MKTIHQRACFYWDLYLKNPNSPACPLENLRGILRNDWGHSESYVNEVLNRLQKEYESISTSNRNS
jgi:hypothetical protein